MLWVVVVHCLCRVADFWDILELAVDVCLVDTQRLGGRLLPVVCTIHGSLVVVLEAALSRRHLFARVLGGVVWQAEARDRSCMGAAIVVDAASRVVNLDDDGLRLCRARLRAEAFCACGHSVLELWSMTTVDAISHWKAHIAALSSKVSVSWLAWTR